jgi:CDP-paratose 2-epimerase
MAKRKNLIIGGAGFIGCNVAKKLMELGEEVVVFDNLSRLGTEQNLEWLRSEGELTFIKGDIRDFATLQDLFRKHRDVSVVYHMAAQVAVTTSVRNPRDDFEVNALGTFNLLEAIRLAGIRPIVIFASTNKVYGEMENVKIEEEETSYRYADFPHGVSEQMPLDFYSPYGCSKGAGDQYVRDYWRIYNIPTIVFRQSCIYGPRQFGVEDQGWVAWFIIAALLNKPITIYGNGKQVRDLLYIDDLIECYLAAIENIEATEGEVFNIGGGPRNQISVLDFLDRVKQLLQRSITYRFAELRPGDQKIYVSDIREAQRAFGWRPKTPIDQGVRKTYKWVVDNHNLFKKLFSAE